MLMLAVAYGALLNLQPELTGHPLVDGTLGLALGLYICSHPAAAAIDLIFMDRVTMQGLASDWSDLGWLALNLVVMIAGCIVTIVGATRFVM
jgi:hypothetical protein